MVNLPKTTASPRRNRLAFVDTRRRRLSGAIYYALDLESQGMNNEQRGVNNCEHYADREMVQASSTSSRGAGAGGGNHQSELCGQ